MPVDWREKPKGGAGGGRPRKIVLGKEKPAAGAAKKEAAAGRPAPRAKRPDGGAAMRPRKAGGGERKPFDKKRPTSSGPRPSSGSSKAAAGKSSSFKPRDKRLSSSSADQHPAAKRHQALAAATQAREERHAKLVQCNKMWNELRQEDTTPERRLELCNDIYSKIKGKIVDYSQRPDTSRVVQSCFKFGSPELRQEILAELHGNLVNLSKGKHSSFLVEALLRHGSSADRATMVSELRPHARVLGTHGSAARVVNCVLSHEGIFPSEHDKERFVEMFYGNEVLLQGVGVSGLAGKAALANPSALSSMKQSLVKMADKGLLRFPYAQRLMNEYLSVCAAEDVRFMTPSIREASLAMVGTWEGALAVVAVLAAADAKERKRLIKEWRGHVVDLAAHQFAWLVVAKTLTFLDDTVFACKSVVDEMVESQQLLGLVLQREGHARKVLLAIAAGEDRVKGYYTDSDRDALFKDYEYSTSLKPATQRRAEVGSKLVPALFTSFISTESESLEQVLVGEGSRTLPSDLLRECLSWPLAEGRQAVCEHLANLAESVLEHPKAHLVLKRVIKDEVAMGDELPKVSFGSLLLSKLQGRLVQLSQISRACFVMAELVKHPHASAAVKREFGARASKLKGDSAGCVALRTALEEQA